MSLSSAIKYIGVLPCDASSLPLSNTESNPELFPTASLIACSFPATIFLPSISALIPLPDCAVKFFGDENVKFSSLAFSTIASASGCSEALSTLAASFKNSLSSISNPIISVTTGLPLVTVPVLSSTTVSIL